MCGKPGTEPQVKIRRFGSDDFGIPAEFGNHSGQGAGKTGDPGNDDKINFFTAQTLRGDLKIIRFGCAVNVDRSGFGDDMVDKSIAAAAHRRSETQQNKCVDFL